MYMEKRLHRSRTDRWIAGVGIFAYLICAVILPDE